MKRTGSLLVLLAALFASGCTTPPPQGFMPFPGTGWTTLEIRNDVNFDRAWSITLETLARDFDFELLSKGDGYMRTAWSQTWNGVFQPHYRVRVTVLFPDNRQTLRIKAEAQAFLEGDGWVVGSDKRLLPGLKEELLGSIGRTLR